MVMSLSRISAPVTPNQAWAGDDTGSFSETTTSPTAASALVAGIPLIMVFVTYAVDPARTSLLWTTTYGWILMGILAVMDVIGFFAIQWVCAIKI